MPAWNVYISELTFVHQYRYLRFTHGELGAVIDLIAFVGELIDDGIFGIVYPFDNLDKFVLDEVKQAHMR